MKVNFINTKLVFKSLTKDVLYTGRAEASPGHPWKIDCPKNSVMKGDIIEINLGQKPVKLRVTALKETTNKENASENFEII